MKLTPIQAADLAVGMTVYITMIKNSLGQSISGIRRSDWLKVRVTEDNIDRYRNGQYLIERVG